MKHYDPKAVEALLEHIGNPSMFFSSRVSWSEETIRLAAAVRSSAREAGEVSEEEKWGLIYETVGTRRAYTDDQVKAAVDAALARFAAPRGRVVEGWATTSKGVVTATSDPELPKAARHWKWDRCLITILDAPPRGEEEANHPCSFPNCGCPEARLCWSKNGPNASAIALLPRGEEG